MIAINYIYYILYYNLFERTTFLIADSINYLRDNLLPFSELDWKEYVHSDMYIFFMLVANRYVILIFFLVFTQRAFTYTKLPC